MEKPFEFCIKIANIVIKIKPFSSEMYEYCKQYLVPLVSQPDFSVEITELDLETEKEYLNTIDVPLYKYKPRNLEISALNRKIADKLLDYNLLLFHSSAIAINSKAILFTAPSGTGKSTHTRFWQQLYGDQLEIINDDKPFLKCEDDKVIVYGSPWNGKARISSLNSAELTSICFLNRGTENKVVSVSQKDIISEVFNQIYIPTDKAKLGKVLYLLDKILSNVKLYSIYCTNSIEAAKHVSKEILK